VLHVDRWGGEAVEASLLERVRDDALAVAEGRFLTERL
jgi:hypothetical protein